MPSWTSPFLRTATGGLEVLGAALVIAAGLVVGLLVADATLTPRPNIRAGGARARE